LGGVVAMLLRLQRCACGHDAQTEAPLKNFFLAALRDGDDHILHPHFFAGNNVEHRVTGPDERLDFELEVHGFTLVSSQIEGKSFFVSASTCVMTRCLMVSSAGFNSASTVAISGVRLCM